MMGDLIIVKSPSIPVQRILEDYIDRCIITILRIMLYQFFSVAAYSDLWFVHYSSLVLTVSCPMIIIIQFHVYCYLAY